MTTHRSALFPLQGMKYWDDFELRAQETAAALAAGALPPLRRMSLHVTNGCNFACAYCNEVHSPRTMPFDIFAKIVSEYAEMGGGIVHVTGGEPTVVRDFPTYIREAAKFPAINFHLNTNLYNDLLSEELLPTVRRLKVSLDTHDPRYFNGVCNRAGAFERVVANLDRVHHLIERGQAQTIVSLTYTVTRENYAGIPAFLRMYGARWPRFYAAFFSAYKGLDPRFALTPEETADLFDTIVPQIDALGDLETRSLWHASHEARTFHDRERFPENRSHPCHLQLSELVIDETGGLWNCSHLYRDKVPGTGLNIRDAHLRHLFAAAKGGIASYPLADQCLYGCNKKLTTFNAVVERLHRADSAQPL